jgi:DNA-binding Lrp family transcriptional regulator
MDATEMEFIAHLRQNARQPLRRISSKINIPVSTLYAKLRMYESWFIKKHTCLIDYSKLGFGLKAVLIIKTDKNSREQFKNYLSRHHNVNTSYQLNNGCEFYIEAVFKNIKDLHLLMEEIEDKFSVKSKAMHYVLEEVKTEGFMSDPAMVGML